MSNTYIDDFKTTVNDFYSKALTLAQAKKSNTERYTAEYAISENAKADEQLASAYSTAKDKINASFENVRELLAISNFPSVEALSGDRIFFEKESKIDLSPAEFSAYIEKHKDNPTMLRIIKKWADEKHSELSDYTPSIKRIVLPSDKVTVYKAFAETALSHIESIYANPLATDKLSVSAYADESFAKELFDVIGSGNELSAFKNKYVPESAKHAFDNVTLSEDKNGNFEFNFRGINTSVS